MLDPYRRYRHARVIHAIRVSLGLLATILLTTGINLPHGEWASVTMLVVIGGLQHHGNIGKKAAERAIGTLIGVGVGLLLVAQQAWLGMPWLTYFAMAVVCGFFSYHAIGKGGYTALLSAITVFIVRINRPVELPSDSSLAAPVYNPLDGYRLLVRQLASNIGEMRQRLAKTAPRWNI
ncbi:MAG: FUSC family protein [Pseudomonas sp.]